MGILLSIIYWGPNTTITWNQRCSGQPNKGDRGSDPKLALENSPLKDVPCEIFRCIADNMSPSSIATFALTCRLVLGVIGSQCLKNVQSCPPSEHYHFLQLLERDLPDHITCYCCKRLHPIDDAPHRYLNLSVSAYYRKSCQQYPSKVTTFDMDCKMRSYAFYEFSFVVFQMAMKRYRQGRDTSLFLSLLSASYTFHFFNPTELHVYGAKISHGSMYLRHQSLFVVKHTHDERQQFPRCTGFMVCPHWSFIMAGTWSEPGRMLLERWARWTEHGESEGSPELLQCRHCTTEFRIDFKDLGEVGTGVFFTKWQDIGEGRSYLDPKWQHHIDHIERDHESMWEEEVFEPGSLCAAYEEGIPYEFDSLWTPEAKKKICEGDSPS